MTDTGPGTRATGHEAREDIRRSGERLAEDSRAAAEDAGARLRDEAWQQGDRAKSGVASEMSGIAEALRKAAAEMRGGSPQERTFGQLAEGLADASETVRSRDMGQLAGDVSDFARRNPVAFLGGAALAGFAVSRFAKASNRTPRGGYAGESGAGLPQRTSGAMPPARPETDRVPGPATTPVGATPGTDTPATATPSPTATKTPGDY